MDVLAGRKTGGYIEGDIRISGYPKNQSTFARISGYCEQNDIHSPQVTVRESLIYSAWLRLASDINDQKKMVSCNLIMSCSSFHVNLNIHHKKWSLAIHESLVTNQIVMCSSSLPLYHGKGSKRSSFFLISNLEVFLEDDSFVFFLRRSW
jgi:hypothetical protein